MTYAEGEDSILWPLDAKSQLIKEDPDAGKDRRGRQRIRLLDVNEFDQAPGDGEGQGSLVCCSPWGCKELDTTVRVFCLCFPLEVL